jgi:hypothetical protein
MVLVVATIIRRSNIILVSFAKTLPPNNEWSRVAKVREPLKKRHNVVHLKHSCTHRKTWSLSWRLTNKKTCLHDLAIADERDRRLLVLRLHHGRQLARHRRHRRDGVDRAGRWRQRHRHQPAQRTFAFVVYFFRCVEMQIRRRQRRRRQNGTKDSNRLVLHRRQ